jgi:hypothetical protein
VDEGETRGKGVALHTQEERVAGKAQHRARALAEPESQMSGRDRGQRDEQDPLAGAQLVRAREALAGGDQQHQPD